jgi:hypothetical protein
VVSASLDRLPLVAATACSRLREELGQILGDELVALWAYGSVTFPDPPRRLGDVDVHALLSTPPDTRLVRRIRSAHDRLAREVGVEWDAWYVLASEAGGSSFPRHLLRQAEMRDEAWALHRAHWLAGRYVLLYGRRPEEIVPVPTWAELEEGLRLELAHIERHVAARENDPHEAAYALLNGCRILASLETRDVVISKRDACAWGLEHLPLRWHEAARVAARVYDAEADPEDAEVLSEAMAPFIAMVSLAIARTHSGGGGEGRGPARQR